MATHAQATGNKLLKAWTRAMKVLESDPKCVATEQDAGFVIPAGQGRGPKTGYQVFVKVCRYDERLLMDEPVTGGLLVHRKSTD